MSTRPSSFLPRCAAGTSPPYTSKLQSFLRIYCMIAQSAKEIVREAGRCFGCGSHRDERVDADAPLHKKIAVISTGFFIAELAKVIVRTGT